MIPSIAVRLVAVAVPVPFLGSLTYNVPPHLPMPPVGARVLVPIGSRTVTGCVIDLLTEAVTAPDAPSAGQTSAPQLDPAAVKDVIDVLDPQGLVPSEVVDLCRFVADYYLSGIGDALGSALPPGSRTTGGVRPRVRRVVSLTAHGASRAASSSSADPEPPARSTAATDELSSRRWQRRRSV